VMDLFPRSASVRAVEDCTAIRLSAANLYEVYACPSSEFLGQRAAPIKGGSGSSG